MAHSCHGRLLFRRWPSRRAQTSTLSLRDQVLPPRDVTANVVQRERSHGQASSLKWLLSIPGVITKIRVKFQTYKTPICR